MGSKKILTVDDSRFSLAMIQSHILEVHPQWGVDSAANGEEALGKTANHTYDLITIDYNMPGMSGLDLVEKLREQGCSSKLVLLTANVQESMAQKARSLDIGFVKKPITPDTIAEIISYLE
ncbi:response regulator [Desulfurispira natronophila]|uniref:CheY-like chemotaxis protein n=1 Tax=Desulfurispira natronophila TaxID=682562 RepID=A0A7W7Y4R4_9BACT|nr:response regulator [Desulfurispira natronophila]MBB5022009.1 CheY-like chemotaxis protein [Desulfurispira natronophila]